MARRIFLCALIVVLVSTLSLAQTVKKTPAPYTNPASGSEMFKAYCASCHGVDGKGNGPAASAMKAPLPDLTQLSKKNGGTYPANHVAAIISGDANSPSMVLSASCPPLAIGQPITRSSPPVIRCR